MELKTQLKNERDKVTEETEKNCYQRTREKEGKALRDKLDDQQKHFAKKNSNLILRTKSYLHKSEEI